MNVDPGIHQYLHCISLLFRVSLAIVYNRYIIPYETR